MKYLTLALSVISLNSAANTLCLEDEGVEFSCKFNTKTVSVCSTDEHQTYRFGKPSSIEMELHSEQAIERYTFSGGGEMVMTFKNGRYSYAIESRTVRTEYLIGGWDIETTASLSVSLKDKTLANWECKDIYQ